MKIKSKRNISKKFVIKATKHSLTVYTINKVTELLVKRVEVKKKKIINKMTRLKKSRRTQN